MKVLETKLDSLFSPGRVDWSSSEGCYKIFSFVNTSILESLSTNGVCVPDESKVEPYFVDAYRWLASHVNKTADPVCENFGMFWGWARNTKAEMLYMAKGAAKDDGGTSVMFEANIPIERLVLSDHSSWHCPLNNAELLSPEEELIAEASVDEDGWLNWESPFEKLVYSRLERVSDWPSSLEEYTEVERKILLNSWDRCLRTAPKPGEAVQASWARWYEDDVETAYIFSA